MFQSDFFMTHMTSMALRLQGWCEIWISIVLPKQLSNSNDVGRTRGDKAVAVEQCSWSCHRQLAMKNMRKLGKVLWCSIFKMFELSSGHTLSYIIISHRINSHPPWADYPKGSYCQGSASAKLWDPELAANANRLVHPCSLIFFKPKYI